MSNQPKAASGATPGSKFGASPLALASFALVLVGLVVLPLVVTNPFYQNLCTRILVFGLLAMSLDVLLGFTGLLSFMHNAYLGLGAYAAGLFMLNVNPESLWLAMFTGIAFTMLIALPVGWLQVRTGGLAFALLTMAFGMMFYTVAFKWYDFTGGDDGLVAAIDYGLPEVAAKGMVPYLDIQIGPWVLGNTANPVHVYYLVAAIVLLAFLLTRRVIHSPLGAVLEAIRENEQRASFVGINVRGYKLIGWMIACGLAGVAGTLWMITERNIAPDTMHAFEGAEVLMMVLLGGMGSLWGSFVGAGIFIFMKDYLSSATEHWEVYVGLVVILLVLFLPKGVAGLTDKLKPKSGKGE